VVESALRVFPVVRPVAPTYSVFIECAGPRVVLWDFIPVRQVQFKWRLHVMHGRILPERKLLFTKKNDGSYYLAPCLTGSEPRDMAKIPSLGPSSPRSSRPELPCKSSGASNFRREVRQSDVFIDENQHSFVATLSAMREPLIASRENTLTPLDNESFVTGE